MTFQIPLNEYESDYLNLVIEEIFEFGVENPDEKIWIEVVSNCKFSEEYNELYCDTVEEFGYSDFYEFLREEDYLPDFIDWVNVNIRRKNEKLL